ncbi:MAG: SRPBCC family protein [Ilumatobacteraceae bacterium]
MDTSPATGDLIGPVVDGHTPTRLAAQRLRNTLRLNAATSLAGGALAAVAPSRVDGWLDTGHAGSVRVVGLGLAVFVVGVVITAGARMSRLLRWVPVVVVGDAVWVLASVVTIFAGWYAVAGDLIVGAVAVMVAAFAFAQCAGWLRTRSSIVDLVAVDEAPPVEVVHVERQVSVDPGRAWAIVTDHDLYGRLAPNLSRVHATTGNGPGLERTCTNRKGHAWTESCTLWDDGHRFDIAVDTSNYPYPLDVMSGSWSVTAHPHDPNRCTVGMDFRYQPTRSIAGRLFAGLMQAAFPFVLRRIVAGWRSTAEAAGEP